MGIISFCVPLDGGECSTPQTLEVTPASTLADFSTALLRICLQRRQFTSDERTVMKHRLGGTYSARGSLNYGMLKWHLHYALDDDAFTARSAVVARCSSSLACSRR